MQQRDLTTMFVLTSSLLGGCVVPLPGNLDAGGDTSSDDTDEADGVGVPFDLANPGDGDGDPGDGDPGDGDPIDLSGGQETNDPNEGCSEFGTCNQIDLLFVIDNSGTMIEEQINLSENLPLLLDALLALVDEQGNPLEPDINIMFTTTDVGHPHCTPFQPNNYMPALGAPRDQACIDRLDDFEGLGSNAPEFPEACTTGCPRAVEPVGPFIHLEGPMATTTNVPGNDISGAMQCLAPQGINGCGYESPLEAMIQAINPAAAWNQGSHPFVRDQGVLAIVIVTDEEDCSVRPPEGHAYWEDPMDTYWEINPETGTKTQPTSAVCWNAGVECTGLDPDGVYEECHSVEHDVLHPLERYSAYLQTELIDMQDKEVVMLGILGVPSVTQHNDELPHQPIQGGVDELVYRQWQDGLYPLGDILPIEDEDVTADMKQFEFGIGPGCTGEDGMGGFSGQAIPPVRIKEVCQSLDEDDKVRCCIESICDTDFSGAFQCLAGVIQQAAVPPG
jgi:hypothetical protein